MVTLHRFGAGREAFLVNADLIATVQAHPDTVVTLTTGTRFVVAETPSEVADAICAWRAGILADVPGLVAGAAPLKSPPPRPITRRIDVPAEPARFAGVAH
jgi:flagellar protein FlbD